MEYVKVIFYAMLFAIGIMLAGFNLIYSLRVNNTNYKLGIGTPRMLKRAIGLNAMIAILGSFAIALTLANALLSLEIPAFL